MTKCIKSNLNLASIVQLKEIGHENIKAFIGACVTPGNICYLMQHCSRRTLQVRIYNPFANIQPFHKKSIELNIVVSFECGFMTSGIFQSARVAVLKRVWLAVEWMVSLLSSSVAILVGFDRIADARLTNNLHLFARNNDTRWPAVEFCCWSRFTRPSQIRLRLYRKNDH